ncbi:MAG: PspA/IM30 family protein [Promethearchaeota archaeon]|jgi:phage shock protein A
MSFFKRLFKIGEAHANNAVDALENPELMLEQAIRDKEAEIKEAKRAVMQCIATERGTRTELDKEKKLKSEWEKKAELALKKGDEALATKALERSGQHEENSKTLNVSWKKQKAAVDDLKGTIVGMENQLAEYKRSKDTLIAQSKTADLKKSVFEAKAKISKDSGADDLMARMKAKIDREENEADAAQEMAELGDDGLENEFAELDSAATNEAIQDKLAAMKAKLNKE